MGCIEAKAGDVAMTKWLPAFSVDQIVERARSWIGKPTAHATWHSDPSCAHLMVHAYGWPNGIPRSWTDLTPEYLVEISGWEGKKEGSPGDLALFQIRGKDHIGIITGKDRFVHAGTRTYVEVPFGRYQIYFKGVLSWL